MAQIRLLCARLLLHFGRLKDKRQIQELNAVSSCAFGHGRRVGAHTLANLKRKSDENTTRMLLKVGPSQIQLDKRPANEIERISERSTSKP